jgi:hypothetical protein
MEIGDFFPTGLERPCCWEGESAIFFLPGWASNGGTVGGWDIFRMGPHLMLILYIVGKNLKAPNAYKRG